MGDGRTDTRGVCAVLAQCRGPGEHRPTPLHLQAIPASRGGPKVLHLHEHLPPVLLRGRQTVYPRPDTESGIEGRGGS